MRAPSRDQLGVKIQHPSKTVSNVSRLSSNDFSQSSSLCDPGRFATKRIFLPSGDRLSHVGFIPVEVTGCPWALILPAPGSKGSDHARVDSICVEKASRLPSEESAMSVSLLIPAVNRSGAAIHRNVCGSTATFHNFLSHCEVAQK